MDLVATARIALRGTSREGWGGEGRGRGEQTPGKSRPKRFYRTLRVL